MADSEQRRRAWHALGLGPLWLPIEARLPGAPRRPAMQSTRMAEEETVAHTPASESWQPTGTSLPPVVPQEHRSASASEVLASTPVTAGDLIAPRPAADRRDAAAAAAPDGRMPGQTKARQASAGTNEPAAPAAGQPPARAADTRRPDGRRLAQTLGQALGLPAQVFTEGGPSNPPPAVAEAPAADLPDVLPPEAWLEPWEADDGWTDGPAGIPEEPPGFWDEMAPPGADAAEAAGSAADVSAAAGEGRPQAPTMPQRWQALREAVADCQRCRLAETRQNVVFGRGRPDQARWLLIGEAPGAEEDRQGEAFVGQAGRLLDAMLQAAGIDPDADVFIANVLKCRPPGNRNPEADEVARCQGFLHEQIRLSRPDCILLLGRFAAQSVLQSELPIGRLRNRLHHITLDGRRIPVVVTYHPAYLLRNQADKRKSWEDLCLALSAIEEGTDPPRPLASRPGH